MKYLFALLVSLLMLGCSPQPLSPLEFTRTFAAAVDAQAGAGFKSTIKAELEVEVKRSSGDSVTAYLDNAYKAYRLDPKALNDVVSKYVKTLAESSAPSAASIAVDRTRIVPVVKDRQWLEGLVRLHASRGDKDKAVSTVSEPLNDELIIVYAEDFENSIRYLTEERLKEAGVPRAELRALAIDNLTRLLPEVALQKGPQLSMFTAGGDYEASLLLIERLWTKGTIDVPGEIVVAVPAKDLLLVTGSGDPAAMAKMQSLATESVRDSAYALTDTLFVYRGGRFVRFDAAAGPAKTAGSQALP